MASLRNGRAPPQAKRRPGQPAARTDSLMTISLIILLLVMIAVLTIASYLERIYAEIGKFLSREFQENIEAFEKHVEPRLGTLRDRAPISMHVLTQLCTAFIA